MIKKQKFLFLIIGCLASLLCISIGVQLYNRSNNQDIGRKQVLVDKADSDIETMVQQDTVQWEKKIENRAAVGTGIKIPGYGEISVNKGAGTMEMALVNPKDNPCYFQFTVSITVKKQQVTLYQSKLVRQGEAIKEFPVNNLPEAGDYDMKVAISTYSLQDGKTPLNGAQVATVLHIV